MVVSTISADSPIDLLPHRQNGESGLPRVRPFPSAGPSIKRSTSPTVIDSGEPREQVAAFGAAPRFDEPALLQR